MTTRTAERPLTLYDLAEAYKALEDILATDDTTRDEWQATLNRIEEQFTDKALAIIRLIKNFEASEEAYKAEADRLQKRARSIRDRREWLKGYLKDQMVEMGIDKIEGIPGARLLINPVPSVEITVGVEALPERYIRHIEYNEPDKAKMIEDWKAGGWIDIPGVTLSRGKHIRIG